MRPAFVRAGAAVLVLVMGACSLFGSGAGASAPGLPPDASSAQVTADEVLQALVGAWNASTAVCLDAEDAGALKAGSCASVLLPAHDALLAAGAAIDAWNAGQSGAFACAVADVVHGLVAVEGLITDAHGTVPQAVADGLAMAQGLSAFCAQSGPGFVSKDAPGAPLPTFDAGGQ